MGLCLRWYYRTVFENPTLAIIVRIVPVLNVEIFSTILVNLFIASIFACTCTQYWMLGLLISIVVVAADCVAALAEGGSGGLFSGSSRISSKMALVIEVAEGGRGGLIKDL